MGADGKQEKIASQLQPRQENLYDGLILYCTRGQCQAPDGRNEYETCFVRWRFRCLGREEEKRTDGMVCPSNQERTAKLPAEVTAMRMRKM